MDNVYEISLLLDFYGQLLTTRQQEIMDLHINNDFSLGEIAQQLDISRQGVFDNIKRGKNSLNELEAKLGLVKKFSEQKAKAKEILKYLNDMELTQLNSENFERIKKIEDGINYIINEI